MSCFVSHHIIYKWLQIPNCVVGKNENVLSSTRMEPLQPGSDRNVPILDKCLRNRFLSIFNGYRCRLHVPKCVSISLALTVFLLLLPISQNWAHPERIRETTYKLLLIYFSRSYDTRKHKHVFAAKWSTGPLTLRSDVEFCRPLISYRRGGRALYATCMSPIY